ncbi:hypothetical protein GCM10010252_78160 [Streptomyces aureoverticillatus]|nr:hypothetical protein GCM10010252_78160 [Streptomyces aureoverticillatus]
MQTTELLKEFKKQYSQLSKIKKLTLKPNKINLFLQTADEKLQKKLKPLLENKKKMKN